MTSSGCSDRLLQAAAVATEAITARVSVSCIHVIWCRLSRVPVRATESEINSLLVCELVVGARQCNYARRSASNEKSIKLGDRGGEEENTRRVGREEGGDKKGRWRQGK